MVNWQYPCGGGPTDDEQKLFSAAGHINEPMWRVFVRVLERAAAHGLIVDVTFTRDTYEAPIPVDAYRTAIAGVAGRLLAAGGHRHVLFDIQNEYPNPWADRGRRARHPAGGRRRRPSAHRHGIGRRRRYPRRSRDGRRGLSRFARGRLVRGRRGTPADRGGQEDDCAATEAGLPAGTDAVQEVPSDLRAQRVAAERIRAARGEPCAPGRRGGMDLPHEAVVRFEEPDPRPDSGGRCGIRRASSKRSVRRPGHLPAGDSEGYRGPGVLGTRASRLPHVLARPAQQVGGRLGGERNRRNPRAAGGAQRGGCFGRPSSAGRFTPIARPPQQIG